MKLKCFSSPILSQNKFQHGFFTKSISKNNLSLISNYFNKKNCDCFLNQIHSNHIVSGSRTQTERLIEADGIMSDEYNQNLWIYTADCMPILLADKNKRVVAALHCGRRGLEKNIIKILVQKFEKIGSSRKNLIVAIGPSISKKNYLVDNKTFNKFHKKINLKKLKNHENYFEKILNIRNLITPKKQAFIELDLRKYAHMQLLNEHIPEANIDISSLCTYESDIDFSSWRRSKTSSRQWSCICT